MSGKRKEKKWILAAAAAAVCLVTACVWIGIAEEEERTSIRVGVSIYQSGDTYVNLLAKKLEWQLDRYQEEEGVTISYNLVSAKGDAGIQNAQVERFVALGYDVVCVNPVDRTDVAGMIDRTAAADVPLIFFNRQPVRDDLLRGRNVYYVGSDAQESGRLQGELVAEKYRENPGLLDRNGDGVIEYALMEGETGHQDALSRSEWCVKAIVNEGIEMRRVTGGVANWMRDQASALSAQWLSQYSGEIELILCNNDDMALGALDAIEDRQAEGVCVVGIDGTEEGICAVDSGKMLGTIRADVDQYAKYLADMICFLKNDSQISEEIIQGDRREVWIPWEKYTK